MGLISVDEVLSIIMAAFDPAREIVAANDWAADGYEAACVTVGALGPILARICRLETTKVKEAAPHA